MANIHDGYTDNAYLAEARCFYPEVRFKFRRTSYQERLNWQNVSDKEAARKAAELVAKKVVAWDLKGHDGEVLPIDSATLQDPDKVHPTLFGRLLGIVLGIAAWDEDPQHEDKETAEQKAQAEAEGRAFGDVRDEADAKN